MRERACKPICTKPQVTREKMQDTLTRVIDCLAITTRYPKRLLTPEADLEADLGIDSVKLVEIIIALSEEFGVEIKNEQRDPSIRTIGKLADWIDGFLSAKQPQPQAAVVTPTQPVASPVAQMPVAQVTPVAQTPVTPMNGQKDLQSRVDSGRTPLAPRPHVSVDDYVEQGRSPRRLENAAVHAKPLAGRVALVTGSGRGVGKTVARVLAQRGATVVVNSFHSRDQGEQTAEEIRSAGGSAIHLWGSVANPSQVDSIFEQIEAEYGGLDILVCNASDGRIGPFLELTPEDWDRAFRTNVVGHHQCAVRAARTMRTRGGGAMVTLSAVGAHQYIDGLGSQGVVKASVESLTRYLACELGSSGIRVNCVAGGPVYGDLISKFPDARVTQDYWESITADGQLSHPLELAETIAFLVSDAARGITGAVWMVDHGFSANADGQRRRRVASDVALSMPSVV